LENLTTLSIFCRFAAVNNYVRILYYLKSHKGPALMNILFNVLTVIFSLVSLTMVVPFLNLLFGAQKLVTTAPPLTMNPNDLIDNFYYLLSGIIIERGKIDALLFICILVVIMFFLKNLFRYLAMFYMAKIRNGVIRDVRYDLYNKVLNLPLQYFSEERKGDLIVRMTNDVQEIQWSIMSSLEVVFREPLSVISFLITLFFMSPQLTLFVLILLPVTGFLIGRVGRTLRKQSTIGQEKMSDLLSMIEETLSGLRIIKGFTAEGIQRIRFSKKNHEYTKVQVSIDRRRDLSAPMSEFLGTIVMVVVMYFGGQLVLGNDSSLSASVFIAFIAVFSQIIPPAKNFATAFYNIQKGIASADRLSKILDAEEVIQDLADAKPINEFNNEIEYKKVFFSYDAEPVLKNIQFRLKKGKTIALVGPSGGGKSTLADLLPRFYDPNSGEIMVDGISIKNLKIHELRKLIGIVTQESILFNDTVFNNIAYGAEQVNETEVIAAAKIANAHEFISAMPDGYHTNIGDRGGKLSGGQRQRLSIARAILKNPPILILDEATSALDTESERLVQDAIIKLMQHRTSLVIAHRLSTIQHADEILVIQKGEIAERGTHHELLSRQGLYKKLFDLQSFV
jgi:subfamily B ATP-binding cassette protein MsbA